MSAAVHSFLTRRVLPFLKSDAAFRFVFITVMFFASLCTIGSYCYVAAGFLLIWGLFVFVYRMGQKGYWRLFRLRRLLLLFTGLSVLTCLLHIQSRFFMNIYYVLWGCVCFFFFFAIHVGRSRRACAKELRRLLEFLLGATNVLMAAGLVLLLFFPKGFSYGGETYAIYQNRFVGVIINANITGFYAMMACLYCVLLPALRQAEGALSPAGIVYYALSSVLNLTALFLSDSNGSFLMLLVFCCFVTFYVILKGYNPTFANIVIRLIAVGMACLVIASVLLLLRTLVQTGASSILKSLEPSSGISTGVTVSNGRIHLRDDTNLPEQAPSASPNRPQTPKEPAKDKGTSKNTTFEHQNKNIDSGRFTIWKESLELFWFHPVMGIGKGNIVPYGDRYLGGLKCDDFHNGFITIAVSYGAAGLSVFLLFAFVCAKTILKSLFRYRTENKRDGRVLTYLTAFCAGYMIYSQFDLSLLADLSYRVLIFWLLGGCAMSYCYSYERSALCRHAPLPPRTRSLRSASKGFS